MESTNECVVSMKILITICLIFLNIPGLFSQNSSNLVTLQTEIKQLIHSAKFSVVTVSAKSSHSYFTKESGLLSLFKNNRQKKKDNYWTIGSGFIYNQEGYIITRSSILGDFDEIKVTLCDETEFDAEYIGTDQNTGLAILKIEEQNLEPTRIGNSDEVSLYSMLMVLGNSMGISPFASFGLMNGFSGEGKFIISAPITPGNIGGAVFNLQGEIIGIITAQLDADVSMMGPSYLDYSQEYSLAIPINQVAQTIDPVIKLHHQKINWLGIKLATDSSRINTLIVESVFDDSPAARVGLKKGDQLIKFNETDLTSPEILRKLIIQTKPGTSVSINFIRHNRALKVFPRIERIWPAGFNPNKPQHLTHKLMEDRNLFIQSPIIVSPEKFQQINSRMIQMESEIQSLKNQIKK
jgi:S1-C subfamily serine protease